MDRRRYRSKGERGETHLPRLSRSPEKRRSGGDGSPYADITSDVQKSAELRLLIERAQPRLSDEAWNVIARLDAWQPPLPNLPVDQTHFQLPARLNPSILARKASYAGLKREEAQARVDRSLRAPEASELAPSPLVMRAYEQRCADIEQLWKLVHPKTYGLLEKYHLTLKPMGSLIAELRPSHILLEDGSRARIYAPVSFVDGMVSRVDEKPVLLMNANLSPVETIRRAIGILRQLENIDHQMGEGTELKNVNKRVSHNSIERTVDIIELNRNFAEYGVPDRFHHVETTVYQEAYDQAIRDAYGRGQINSHILDDQLKALGQQAGKRAVEELEKPRNPIERVFVNKLPEVAPFELREAEVLGLTPLKLDEPEFMETILRWAREVPDGQQTMTQPWIWVYTQDKELMVLPRLLLSGESLYETHHPQAAFGKPVKVAGELCLNITFPSTPGGRVQVEATLLNNKTGHFQADTASLEMYANLVLKGLRKIGISIEKDEETGKEKNIVKPG